MVLDAASATPEMFSAISLEPAAASETLRLISAVVEVCCSTALAIVPWKSLICAMIPLISSIAPRQALMKALLRSL